MIRHRLVLTTLLMALPVTLGGCVAAAIPVLAAGGIITRDTTPDAGPVGTEPIVAVDTKAAADLAASGSGDTGPGARTITPEITPIDMSEPELTVAGAVPVDAGSGAAGEMFAAERINPYAGFYLHATDQARLDPVEAPRRSAILATPGSLEPVTTDCAILPPAVLVDLDPAGGRLDPDRAFAPNPELAEVLAALRLQNVAVFWISGASAGDAGKVRERLLAAGLDAWGRDGLLLMRRADDRKDARRRELAQTHCVVAIAGDARSDFDELFDFLRNPGAAAALDPLVGAGWFLTPAPITAKEN